MIDLLQLGSQWGWAAVILVWILTRASPRLADFFHTVISRRWQRENNKVAKVSELYERMLSEQASAFSILSSNTEALEANSIAIGEMNKAIGQMRKAIEHEFPLITAAIHDLTGRVTRLEQMSWVQTNVKGDSSD